MLKHILTVVKFDSAAGLVQIMQHSVLEGSTHIGGNSCNFMFNRTIFQWTLEDENISA